MNFTRSNRWWERAEQRLGGGPATLSKHPHRFAQNVTPKFLVSGNGCIVKDPDGNEFVDTIAALGPIILGYNHPAVNNAVMQAVNTGPIFSLPHTLEVDVAEIISSMVPCAEQVRFCKNGSDATEAAVRLARYVTGKRQILCSGYHGFHDWYIASTDKAGGILQETQHYTHQFEWRDDIRLKEIWDVFGDDVAAIIVEVPPLEWDNLRASTSAYLRFLCDLAHEVGALFILDEVVTGFRYAQDGAQGLYGVIPDLACIGKAMANGYALAALCGKQEYMQHFTDGTVFFSSTQGGNAVDLAAAHATLTTLRDTDAWDHIALHGTNLGRGLQEIFKQYDLPVRVLGNYARIKIAWHFLTSVATTAELTTLWMAENAKRGILYGTGVVFPMACYDGDIVGRILDAAKQVAVYMRCVIDDVAASRGKQTITALLDTMDGCQPIVGLSYRDHLNTNIWGTTQASNQ